MAALSRGTGPGTANRSALIAVVAAGSLQAAAFGVYETALPLWLSGLGMSFAGMGLIFGLSQIGILGVRMFVGARSDATGRKPFLLNSLFISAGATALLPVWPAAVPIAVWKTARDAAAVVREVMRSLAVFEAAGDKFVRWIGRAVGFEFFFMALGAVTVGLLAERLGWPAVFQVSAALSLAGALVLWRWFREVPRRAVRPAGEPAPSFRPADLLDFSLPRELGLMAAASFVFNAGLMTSHSFYLLLFFRDKFGFSVEALGWLQMLHRFSLGIPMILAGHWLDRRGLRRHYLAILVLTMMAQGGCITLSAVLPVWWMACAAFILHDIVGATWFGPIQASFVQRFARPATRGRDVALVTGLGALGGILGPPLAGLLLDRFAWRDGPFAVSGVLIMAAGLMMLRLRRAPG